MSSPTPSALSNKAFPENTQVFFCTHTHWDREWYGTFQEYRYRLVRLMDRLVDLLEKHPEFRCFNLDGQTVVLEDYLEVRPQQRGRLEALIQKGRLTIGPWYILPDEFLVSGESSIRNLLRGARICREFGVEPPAVGYLPDMFGHISQTPQILRGFNIDTAILWRGLSGDDLPSELRWQAPSGAELLIHHLPEYCGYSNGAFYYSAFPPEARTLRPEPHYWAMMTDDTPFVVQGLQAALRRASDKSTTGILLLMNGIDHIEPSPEVPAILDALREASPELTIHHGTFEEFLQALKSAAHPTELPRVFGELRRTATAQGSYTFVLPNCLSARIHLKQMNARAQTLLERWAEPFDTITSALDQQADSRDLINEAWKQLLLNHPHDSICGCSVDPVHRQMEARFEQACEIGEVLTGAALHRLAARIDTRELGEDRLLLTIFNPLNWPVTDTVVVEVDLEEDWLTARGLPIHPENLYRTLRDVQLLDPHGREVPHHILGMKSVLVHRPWIEHFVPNRAVIRLTMALGVENLPGLGWSSFALSLPAKPRRMAQRLSVADPLELDNGLLWATVSPDGTLTMGRHDSPHEMTHTSLHWFEDGGDNGDSYTYSPPRQDRVVTSLHGPKRIEVVSHNPAWQAVALEWDLELPEGLTADRQVRSETKVSQTIRTVVSLGAGMDRLDFETTLTNVAKDHRLQVCFETGAVREAGDAAATKKSPVHTAAMPFDFTRRTNTVVQPQETVWIEDEPLERPMHGWVQCGEIALLADGLPEYEIVSRKDGSSILKLTLLRAVNYLAAGTHGNTILFGAGPHMETPDQQVLGRRYVYRYALTPADGSMTALHRVARQAAQHQALWRSVVLPSAAGIVPGSERLGFVPKAPNSNHSLARQGQLVVLTGAGIHLSAIKPGPKPGTVVVRFWNALGTDSSATLQWLAGPVAKIERCNLAEVGIGNDGLAVDETGAAALMVAPWEVASLLLHLGSKLA